MPKKSAKNAYFYFMLEYKNKQERRGNKINIKKVSELCSEPWKVNIFIFLNPANNYKTNLCLAFISITKIKI